MDRVKDQPGEGTTEAGLGRIVDQKLLCLIWSLPGLLYALQRWIFEGSHTPTETIFVFCVPLWWPWILATPIVLWLAERLPISDELGPLPSSASTEPKTWVEPGPKSWIAHAAAALTLSSLHMVVILWWSAIVWSSTSDVSLATLLTMLAEPVFMVSLSSYLLVLCAHYIRTLANRLHQRNLQEARLLGRLAEAEIRSLRMQLRPEALAGNLENISVQVLDGEFDAAETAIGNLAQDLRETLRHGDNLPEVWSNPDLERRSRRGPR